MTDERLAYAGIGPRETPERVLWQMQSIARDLELRDFVLRSGAAKGADSAFESGVLEPENAEIYLPWPRAFGHSSSLHTITRDALALAECFHPAWSSCSPAAKKLHARNGYQVLGPDLASPSKFVVCWTHDGKDSGGTGQALRIAAAHGIPVFNLHDPKALDRLFAFVDDLRPAFFRVTDPDLDAPDGAVVDGYRRAGMEWVRQ